MKSPQIIGDDIMKSFNVWSLAEVERIKRIYGMPEASATSAIALTVLGSCVSTLGMLGRTTEHIIAIIKGKKPS